VSFARRQALMLVPLGLVGLAGVAFWKMLDRMESGKFDPHNIGNPMVGKKLPAFSLKGLGAYQGFATADVVAAAAAKPVLLNFYASWCIPCATEADVLGGMAAEGMQIWGVAYTDKLAASQKYLDKYGDPYARIASDADGRVAIDFGVYGVPETFLIDKEGVIRWHLAGPLTEDSVRDDLRPALRSLA
jgi:cytochrome c biogenesis protein CcmG, thiol:disulfide interchange protein DsbE